MTNIHPQDFPKSDVYAVIGNPIAHSKSPQIHAMFAGQTQQNMVYGLLLSEVTEFEQMVSDFFNQGGRGLNVTVPFKNRAYAMCDVLTENAKAAGVVNILWKQDGQLYGDNSDGAGLVKDLIMARGELKGQSVLILGAGGAVQGVILPLMRAGVASIVIVNRTFEKACDLVERFSEQADQLGVALGALESQWIENLDEPFDIVINGTSTGLSNASPLSASQAKHLEVVCQTKKTSQPQAAAFVKELQDSLLTNPTQPSIEPHAETGKDLHQELIQEIDKAIHHQREVLSYDMVYGKPTAFLTQMQQHGFITRDGLGMLVEQAALAFKVWRPLANDQVLNTTEVLERLRSELPSK